MWANCLTWMRSWIPVLRSGRTPELRIYAMTKTPTQLRSGESTEESSWQCEKNNGDNLANLCAALAKLLETKANYYGCVDELDNALSVEVTPWKYQVLRISEKIRRMNGDLCALDLEDTLFDIAGHAIVAVSCIRRRGAK